MKIFRKSCATTQSYETERSHEDDNIEEDEELHPLFKNLVQNTPEAGRKCVSHQCDLEMKTDYDNSNSINYGFEKRLSTAKFTKLHLAIVLVMYKKKDTKCCSNNECRHHTRYRKPVSQRFIEFDIEQQIRTILLREREVTFPTLKLTDPDR
ncbi:unnamed protein product, partial [Didymodactylos carnosus]